MGHSGLVSFRPQMNRAQLPTVSTTQLTSTSRQRNSLLANAASVMSRGSVQARPRRGSATPKRAMAPTMMISGRQAILPMGSPFSDS